MGEDNRSMITTKCTECGNVATFEAFTILHKPGDEWKSTCYNYPSCKSRLFTVIKIKKV